MTWTITDGPLDVTHPACTNAARWKYRIENGCQRVLVTVDIAALDVDPEQQPVLHEAIQSSGVSVLASYLDREGRPPTRILVNSLGIHPSA